MALDFGLLERWLLEPFGEGTRGRKVPSLPLSLFDWGLPIAFFSNVGDLNADESFLVSQL